MAKLIDPEELPFTADEGFEACRTFLSPEQARLIADHFTTIGPADQSPSEATS